MVMCVCVLQVELATGSFPYKNCKNDFEVLTRVLQEDPPVLPPNQGFTTEFCSFVCHWCVLYHEYKLLVQITST